MSHLPPPTRTQAVMAVAAVVMWLMSGWARAQTRQPEMTAVGAAVASGSDLLETSIVAEMLEAPPRGASEPPRFVAAGRLQAGDIVYYTVRVSNPGRAPVTHVVVTKGMPQGLHYIPGSAVGPACDVEFSADSGDTFHRRPDAREYTHVRWNLRRPLPPGATALLRFRAVFR